MNCHDIDACTAGAKNCPMPQFCQHPKLHQIEEPMNNTQKLNDEALQVYLATGLSPLEVKEQRAALMASVAVAANLLFDAGNHKASRELDRLLEQCK